MNEALTSYLQQRDADPAVAKLAGDIDQFVEGDVLWALLPLLPILVQQKRAIERKMAEKGWQRGTRRDVLQAISWWMERES